MIDDSVSFCTDVLYGDKKQTIKQGRYYYRISPLHWPTISSHGFPAVLEDTI